MNPCFQIKARLLAIAATGTIVFLTLLSNNAQADTRSPVWASAYYYQAGDAYWHGSKPQTFATLDALCAYSFKRVMATGYNLDPIKILGYQVFQPGNQCSFVAPPYSILGFDAGMLVCEPGFKQSGSVCVTDGPDPDKNKGCPDCEEPKVTEGNPINIGVGNKFQKETDYIGGGAFPLQWTRSYNSFGSKPGNNMLPGANITASATGSPFALAPADANSYGTYQATLAGLSSHTVIDNGWRHFYDRSITTQMSSVATIGSIATLFRPDSKTRTFIQSNNTVWIADTGEVTTQLTRLVDANQQITGWIYTNEKDEVENYDAAGKLLSIKNRAGLVQTLHYNSQGLLDSVTDPEGRQLKLAYDANQRLSSLVDPANGSYAYSYDGSGNLARVSYPNGRSRQYLYEDTRYPNALTGIINENGGRYASWQYDDQGNASSSQHAGGADKVTLSYDASQTIATDAAGAVRVYTKQTINGVVKPNNIREGWEGCGGNCVRTKSYHFDDNGNMVSRADANGILTYYTYDMLRNVEVSRTEAVGTPQARTITTQWRTDFRLPIQIIEKDATGKALRQTDIAYDSHANKTSEAVKDLVGGASRTTTWAYTYSSTVPGQVDQLVLKGPRTDVEDITTISYWPADAICPNGSVGKAGYDKGCRGEIKQIRNALGQTTQYSRYNPHGQIEQMIDANGVVTNLTYDARQRLTLSSRSVAGSTETTQYQYDGAGQLTLVTQADGSTLSYSYDGAHRLTQIADNLGNRISYTLDAMGNRIAENTYDPAGTLTRSLSRSFDALNRLQSITGS